MRRGQLVNRKPSSKHCHLIIATFKLPPQHCLLNIASSTLPPQHCLLIIASSTLPPQHPFKLPPENESNKVYWQKTPFPFFIICLLLKNILALVWTFLQVWYSDWGPHKGYIIKTKIHLGHKIHNKVILNINTDYVFISFQIWLLIN